MAEDNKIEILLETLLKGQDKVLADVDKLEKSITKKAESMTRSFVETSVSVGAVTGALYKAITAYNNLENSTTKLANASKLLNVPLESLKEFSTNLQTNFYLSNVEANNFTQAVVKLTGSTGNLNLTNQALNSLLDITAANGLSASQGLEAFNQALIGSDEGTEKLFSGKQPSTIYKEYADAIGISVAKMDEVEKKQALLNQIMNTGGVVQGAYNDRMQTYAGKLEIVKNNIEKIFARIGKDVTNVLQPSLNVISDVTDYIGKMDESILTLGASLVGVNAGLVVVISSLKLVGITFSTSLGPLSLFVTGITGVVYAIGKLNAYMTELDDIQKDHEIYKGFSSRNSIKEAEDFLKNDAKKLKEFKKNLQEIDDLEIEFEAKQTAKGRRVKKVLDEKEATKITVVEPKKSEKISSEKSSEKNNKKKSEKKRYVAPKINSKMYDENNAEVLRSMQSESDFSPLRSFEGIKETMNDTNSFINDYQSKMASLTASLNTIQPTLLNASSSFVSSITEGLITAGELSAEQVGIMLLKILSTTLMVASAPLLSNPLTLPFGIALLAAGGVLQGIAAGAQNNIKKRERGGYVDANTPYIVGERGQELFVPNSNGFILNNKQTNEIFEKSVQTNNMNKLVKALIDNTKATQRGFVLSDNFGKVIAETTSKYNLEK